MFEELASIFTPVATGIPAPMSPETVTISPLLAEMFEVLVTTVPERASTIAPVATRLVVLAEMFEELASIFTPVATGIPAPMSPETVTMSPLFVEIFEVLVTTVPERVSTIAPVATRLLVFVDTSPDRFDISVSFVEISVVFVDTSPDRLDMSVSFVKMFEVLASIFTPVATGIPASPLPLITIVFPTRSTKISPLPVIYTVSVFDMLEVVVTSLRFQE